jgi:hypothetical protein
MSRRPAGVALAALVAACARVEPKTVPHDASTMEMQSPFPKGIIMLIFSIAILCEWVEQY